MSALIGFLKKNAYGNNISNNNTGYTNNSNSSGNSSSNSENSSSNNNTVNKELYDRVFLLEKENKLLKDKLELYSNFSYINNQSNRESSIEELNKNINQIIKETVSYTISEFQKREKEQENSNTDSNNITTNDFNDAKTFLYENIHKELVQDNLVNLENIPTLFPNITNIRESYKNIVTNYNKTTSIEGNESVIYKITQLEKEYESSIIEIKDLYKKIKNDYRIKSESYTIVKEIEYSKDPENNNNHNNESHNISNSSILVPYLLNEFKSINKKFIEYFLNDVIYKQQLVGLEKTEIIIPNNKAIKSYIDSNSNKLPSLASINEAYFNKLFSLMKLIKSNFLFKFYNSTLFESKYNNSLNKNKNKDDYDNEDTKDEVSILNKIERYYDKSDLIINNKKHIPKVLQEYLNTNRNISINSTINSDRIDTIEDRTNCIFTIIEDIFSSYKENNNELIEIVNVVKEYYCKDNYSMSIINKISEELDTNKNFNYNLLFKIMVICFEQIENLVELSNINSSINIKLIKYIINNTTNTNNINNISSNQIINTTTMNCNNNNSNRATNLIDNKLSKTDRKNKTNKATNMTNKKNDDMELNLSDYSSDVDGENNTITSNKADDYNKNNVDTKSQLLEIENQLNNAKQMNNKLEEQYSQQLNEKESIIKMLYSEIENLNQKIITQANQIEVLNESNNSPMCDNNNKRNNYDTEISDSEYDLKIKSLEETIIKLKEELNLLHIKDKQLVERVQKDLKVTENLVDRRIIAKQLLLLMDKKTKSDYKYDILEYLAIVLGLDNNERSKLGLKNNPNDDNYNNTYDSNIKSNTTSTANSNTSSNSIDYNDNKNFEGSNPKKSKLDRLSDVLYESLFEDL